MRLLNEIRFHLSFCCVVSQFLVWVEDWDRVVSRRQSETSEEPFGSSSCWVIWRIRIIKPPPLPPWWLLVSFTGFPPSQGLVETLRVGSESGIPSCWYKSNKRMFLLTATVRGQEKVKLETILESKKPVIKSFSPFSSEEAGSLRFPHDSTGWC